MAEKLGIIAIIVEDHSEEKVERINSLLHDYRSIIVGRMGLPYKKRNVSLISLVVDGEENSINALSGKIGMIDGVYSRTTMAGNI